MLESGILLAVLLGAVFSGVSVALSMVLAGLLGIFVFVGPDFIVEAARSSWWFLNNWLIISAFLFLLIAELVTRAELADVLFEGMAKFTSGVRGALAMAVIAGCTLMGVTTGSGIAEVASVGRVSIPPMLKRGYSRTLALGAATASGCLGYLIPPSLFLIIYGAWAGVSVARLFAAALLPGLVMAAMMMVSVAIQVRINPSLAPKLPGLPVKDRLLGLFSTWPVVILGIGILGTIFTGIATPTEAAGIGVLVALLITMIRPSSRRLVNWTYLKESMLNAVKVTSTLMFIVIGASVLSFCWSYFGTPVKVTNWVVGLDIPPVLSLIGLYLLIGMFGCVMEGLSMMILLLPITVPVITALGYDPVWWGVMMGMLVAWADITPPVGMHLFTTKAIYPEYPFGDIVRGTFPFFLTEIVVVAITTAFPIIALWLPRVISV